jgi:CheY-like chemotaxis protein
MPDVRTILIVEDDEDEQEMLADILTNSPSPCKVLFVSTGEEALQFLRTNKTLPHLIISDVNMPGMSGLELKNQINHDKQLGSLMIPFVFLSGAAINFTITLAYKLNIQGYFIKGMEAQEIEASMFRIIDYWCHCQFPQQSVD